MYISENSVHLIYKMAKQVYESKQSLTSAAKDAANKGLMSDGSARIYINIFKCLMNGIGHTRAMNKYATVYFLESIYSDYGQEALARALQATAHHVNYYNSLGKGQRTSIEDIILELTDRYQITPEVYSIHPDEIEFLEGKVKQVFVNKYERNSKARQKAINLHGLNCIVCDFNFEKVYGSIGTGFIHVHHVIDLSEVGSEYCLNVETDLVPVCPNCHAMLHTTKPAMKPEALQKHLARSKH